MICESCIHNAVCKYGEARSNGLYCTGEKCKQYQSTDIVAKSEDIISIPISALTKLTPMKNDVWADFIKNAKAEVAREIFEEIEKIVVKVRVEDTKNFVLSEKQFAELKKKYTSEKECPNCRYFVGCECFDGRTCDEYEEKKE